MRRAPAVAAASRIDPLELSSGALGAKSAGVCIPTTAVEEKRDEVMVSSSGHRRLLLSSRAPHNNNNYYYSALSLLSIIQ